MQMRCRPGRQVPELLILLAGAIVISPIVWRTYRVFLVHPAVAIQPPGWRQHLAALGCSLMVVLLAGALFYLACAAVIRLGELLIRLWERIARERTVRKSRWKHLE